MKLIFVRHGHPDYQKDCLTDLGKKQAEKAAESLLTAGIEQIYASTHGRAQETASYTANQLGLPILPCEFMREIAWRPLDPENEAGLANPWNTAAADVLAGRSLLDPHWRNRAPYCLSEVVGRVDTVISGFDAFLAQLGYQREGDYYRVTRTNTDRTLAIFSHAGSASAAIAHMLNIPLPHFCGLLQFDFTSITTLNLANELGALVYPKLICANDARHTADITEENVFGF